MTTELVPGQTKNQTKDLAEARIASGLTPQLFCGDSDTPGAFWEFFLTQYRNSHTRAAYFRAAVRFANWCEEKNIELADIDTFYMSAYGEQLTQELSLATCKQHMAAISRLFDFLVAHRILYVNPAKSVAMPRQSIRQGKTPHLEPSEMKALFESIELKKPIDYRDRAFIAVMAYTFARVSSVCDLLVKDYYTQSKRSYFNFMSKGNKYLSIPAHHVAQEYLDEYLDVTGFAVSPSEPLFRTLDTKYQEFTDRPMNRFMAYRMVKRRALKAGLGDRITNHSFRATGITTFITNGGALEKAATIAGHANPSTTKLYDRSDDKPTLDEIERILYR